MDYIANTTEFQLNNTAVALGKFEGLHRGHNLLFQELFKYHEKGLKSVIFTFDMSPKAIIDHEYTKSLYTKDERRQLLETTPLDYLIEHPFTPEFSRLRPDEFVSEILVKKCGAKVIVIGEDCHFGYKRSGNAELLRELAPKFGYKLVVIPKLQEEGEDVSSSRIRACISDGRMEEANMLLGEPPYTIFGEVVHGKKLGSTVLNMPTANQAPSAAKFLPPNGVYVSRILSKGKTYYGISNIGVKPTVDDHIEKGVETFIFDFNEDIYGSNIAVSLLHFVRPEQKFACFDDLKEQMYKDADFGRWYASQIDKEFQY